MSGPPDYHEEEALGKAYDCLLYTSDAADDLQPV